MEGYYLLNSHPAGDKVEFSVISDERSFVKLFGKIDKDDYPNFDFEHVLVMAMQPTTKQYFLRFDEMAVKAGDFIEVYCSVRKEKHKLTYLDQPIAVAAIPKYLRLSRVDFYDTNTKKLLKSVHLR